MTSRFVQVSNPKGDLEVVEREIPEPGNNQVRIKIQACGVPLIEQETKKFLINK